jgi:hypothetical protein
MGWLIIHVIVNGLPEPGGALQQSCGGRRIEQVGDGGVSGRHRTDDFQSAREPPPELRPRVALAEEPEDDLRAGDSLG